jgi:demethylspheroidene O-methyltransferase
MKTLDIAQSRAPGWARASWREPFDRWWDQCLTSERFYRWSVSNPLTRWFTRRRSRQVFDLMAGFVYSQILLACVRLDILNRVQDCPQTLEALAEQTQVNPAALQRLLNSAVALQLLTLRGDRRYGLGPLGAPVAAFEGIRAMIEHHATLYQDLSDPVALLRDTLPTAQMEGYWPYVSPDEPARLQQAPNDSFSRYSALMSASQPFVVDEILAAYSFGDHRRVLDVGGGQGTFVTRLAQHAPHLQLELFDLPPVAQLARENIEQKGLTPRIRAHGGSFLTGELPPGADLATLIRIAHDHPDHDVLTLLKAIHHALPPGGTLLLAEPMAQDDPQAAQGDAYFHFYLLAMGSGRLRTRHELSSLMEQAGFCLIEAVPTQIPLHTQILIGRKSKCLP